MMLIDGCRIEALVLDLDGTLLDSSGNIDESTCNLLTELHSTIKIILATSRSRRSVIGVLPIKFPFDAAIYDNGADLSIGEQINVTNFINEETAGKVYSTVLDLFEDSLIACEAKNSLYSNFDVSQFWKGTNYIEVKNKGFPCLNIKRILVFKHDRLTTAKFKCLCDNLKELCSVYLTDQKRLIQIIEKGTSKYRSLCEILKYWNISIGNVVCFGDDYPDKELIEKCGIGVAMGNAVDEVRQVSKYVALSNDECGVKCFIYNYYT